MPHRHVTDGVRGDEWHTISYHAVSAEVDSIVGSPCRDVPDTGREYLIKASAPSKTALPTLAIVRVVLSFTRQYTLLPALFLLTPSVVLVSQPPAVLDHICRALVTLLNGWQRLRGRVRAVGAH